MKTAGHARRLFVVFALVFSLCGGLQSDEIPIGAKGYESRVAPFFKTQCLRCHGTDKQKGGITLHDLDGDFFTEQGVERWALILEMLESGEMPPQDQPQPAATERNQIVEWIDGELRALSTKSGQSANVPTARRLTNFEYQNTMRDLLGFELKLIDILPKDPAKPYRFNNTAQFMRMGPEQIDRYLECARRAMASAIVDPGTPKIHTTRTEWKPHGLDQGLGSDELGVWGNRRNTPAWGMRLRSFPKTGEFKIRVKASAILPEGDHRVTVAPDHGKYDQYQQLGTTSRADRDGETDEQSR